MKIKSITTVTHEKQTENDPYKSQYREFNANGDVLVETRYNSDGEVLSKTVNIYNEQHQTTRTEFYDAEQETTEIHDFFYDNRGNLIRETVDFEQGFITVYNYKYNSDGNEIRISEQDEDGEVEEVKIQRYDANGNLLSEQIFDDENHMISETINQLDHNQRLIRKEETDCRYKTSQIHEYYYHESGRLTGIKTVNQKAKVLNWVKLEFDEKNRPVRQTSMSGAGIVMEYSGENTRSERHIDAYGRVVLELETITDNDGRVLKEISPDSVTEYRYEFFTEE